MSLRSFQEDSYESENLLMHFLFVLGNASEQQLPTDRGVVSFDSEDELLVMEPLLRLMKPKPAPPPPPLPPLKRASSLGKIIIFFLF